MKKLLLIFSLFSLCASAFGQQKELKKELRPAYLNLSYSIQHLDLGDGDKLDANYGAAFTVGRSFYLNKNKPLARMIRFGIDATWLDLNYANYSQTYQYEGHEETSQMHQAEIGMQVGPSIHIAPVRRLNAHLYFRYAPTFGAIYSEDTFGGNYASFFVTGISVNYGAIGVGAERRWGSCKYKEFGGGDSEEGDSSASRLKTAGMRVYITFRF